MAEPREMKRWACGYSARARSSTADSQFRQPRAGFFRVQADRKGADFLPAHSPRVWARCVTASAARCVTATAAWYGLSSRSKGKRN